MTPSFWDYFFQTFLCCLVVAVVVVVVAVVVAEEGDPLLHPDKRQSCSQVVTLACPS